MMRLESVLLLLMVPGVFCLFAVPPPKSGQDQFELLLPAPVVVRTSPTEHESGAAAGGDGSWLSAVLAPPGVGVLVGSRMVLRLEEAGRLEELLAERPLTLARQVDAGTFILQAADARTALNQAQDLARQSGVLASHPVMRHSARLHEPYHRQPNDSYFSELWHLENRESDGKPAGADLNARAAWPLTRGAGTLIAVADDGVEFTHPDLEASALDAPHFDFESNNTNGLPPASWSAHGTAVAGLIAATMNNRRGTAGVAPEARVASWVIFGTNDLVDDEALMDMYQYRSNMVSVQNHSWGFGGVEQLGPSLLEEIGISNAVTSGRDGLGVVMVRSGGNSRTTDDFGGLARGNANNDGYVSDSRVIGVGAVRSDGRVSSYSNPGSTLLVAAPGGDVEPGARTLFTTDRIGSLGYNQNQSASDDLADYAFDETGFIGTSGAAPQVSAIAALILSVNPSLHYRDVQHILLLSARHFDLADPDVSTNAAGLRVSHNVGFGIPDAGRAVRLAEAWTKRPPATRVTYSSDEVKMVPEDAMRVHVSGSGLPSGLTNLVSRPPVRGPRADVATAGLALVDLGLASEPVAMDLTGRAALIQRGENFFQEKIGHAASAGASFAIIYNNTGQTELVPMDISEFTPIPAVFIGQTDGEALQQRLLDGLPTWAGLHLEAARYTFEVTETLL
ncbi:MAG TPA: S8 family serine peptidase, partial [Methylomirabilota bacterium]|nr:S8 family serine peptidase [Methylomirabilota bacterium]